MGECPAPRLGGQLPLHKKVPSNAMQIFTTRKLGPRKPTPSLPYALAWQGGGALAAADLRG